MELNSHSILLDDPLLQPYAHEIMLRKEGLAKAKERLMPGGGELTDFANGHLYFGFHRLRHGWVYREWAPNAKAITLFGDFNGWQRGEYQMQRLDNGCWELHLFGDDTLRHGDKVRIEITTEKEILERVPLYARRVVQNPDTLSFDGQIWLPEKPYHWMFDDYKRPLDEPPLVYECHVGMSGECKGITTFRDFTENVLPRIRRTGYNTVQLMAVMEHPYYGSFGYQVSNFFAVSSRFGTPEDFKALVDAAHGYGVAVVLDLVHSHAAANEVEGLARFDGTVTQFFHEGNYGVHPQWGTRLFNYSKSEVLHFLLSNLKFWLEEYHLDGFRFDGVTSMLYRDHGIGHSFGGYEEYFSPNTDPDAVTYLGLAMELCHDLKPSCLLVAEDVSGMPGLCRPAAEGGIGFDYRLGMNMPDFWVKTISTRRDEDWPMSELWKELNQRRAGEATIAYCECHDQAMVGEKTIMFRLADADMYWDMENNSENENINRAVALHKMIRLVTFASGGEGYLNFMGNEFGHPDWIDFPREGNSYSYTHAQRQWHLVDDENLLYHSLWRFDREMLALAQDGELMAAPARLLVLDETNKLLAFTRGGYVFLFNFHPTSGSVLSLPTEADSTAPKLVLHTGWQRFGGGLEDDRDPNGTNQGTAVPMERRSAAVYQIKDGLSPYPVQ